MKVRMRAGWAASVCATGVLIAASACGSGDDGSGQGDSEESSPEETIEVDPISAEIRSWDGVCDVFDPDAIADELGAIYEEDGPVEIAEDEGTFLGALSCNALFVPESDPEQSQGYMYLHLSPSDNAELAKEQYDEIWNDDFTNASEEDPGTQLMLASEEDIAGDWDEAALFVSVGNDGDRVWAYFLKGSYMVQIQLQWGPDKGIHNAAIDGEEDLSEFAELDFTPLDIGSWVKNTYLPQVYDAVEAKIAEGAGE